MEHHDVRAQPFDMVEKVGAVEDGLAARRQDRDKVAQDEAGREVEAGLRLVQNEKIGIMQQRGDDQYLLPHALRVPTHRLVGGAVRPNSSRSGAIFVCAERIPGVDAGGQPDPDAHGPTGRVEVRLLGHVADAGLVLDQAIGDIDAVEPDLAGRRFPQPGQNRDRRRFAGAIRPEQTNDGARATVKLTSRMAGSPNRTSSVPRLEHGLHCGNLVVKGDHMSRESLGHFELLVILALIRQGDEAYGVPIAQAIAQSTGKQVILASVYNTLERLEQKGMVRSTWGEPTAGARRPRQTVFSITTAGMREVRAAKKALTLSGAAYPSTKDEHGHPSICSMAPDSDETAPGPGRLSSEICWKRLAVADS